MHTARVVNLEKPSSKQNVTPRPQNAKKENCSSQANRKAATQLAQHDGNATQTSRRRISYLMLLKT